MREIQNFVRYFSESTNPKYKGRLFETLIFGLTLIFGNLIYGLKLLGDWIKHWIDSIN